MVVAAEADGTLSDFDMRAFYTQHVQQVLDSDLDDDEQAPRLSYETFTAMALQEALLELMLDNGLLAHRGKGDSYDHRLTLPDRGS